MPDFTLAELRDYLVALDVLQRMGYRAEDAGFAPVFSLFPGQVPIVTLPDARLPLGTMGRFDPVQSVVPSVAQIDRRIEAARESVARPVVVLERDLDRAAPADDEIDVSAGATSSLSQAESLPGSLTGQATKPSRPAWTDAEVEVVIEAMALAKLSGERGARTRALDEVAAKLRRGRPATELITRTQAKDRIAARVAELVAAQNAEAGGASPAPEQARDVAAAVSAAPARADEDAAAQAGTLPAEQAGAGDVEPIAPAPADLAPLPPLPMDALTDHLLRPMTRRNRAVKDDLALMKMWVAKIPTGMIATELGLQPHEVMATFDRLTGYDRTTKARRYAATDVEARLRILAAHAAANPATAAA